MSEGREMRIVPKRTCPGLGERPVLKIQSRFKIRNLLVKDWAQSEKVQ